LQTEIIVYTDGAALGNPGKGGYGVVMKFGNHRKELSEAFAHTTNNRMELLAVITALECIKPNAHVIKIHTDSKYVCDAINLRWIDGWVKKGWKNVKNIDLWKRFLVAYKQHQVKFVWVKGHAGIVENERCDELATAAAAKGPWKTDIGYIDANKKNDHSLL
jgi:ribonuclease HI